MATPKTQQTKASVTEFIAAVEPEERRKDCKALDKIFKEATGLKPAVWGDSIIGYGKYHYKSERSKQEGDWFFAGFSPRKQNLSIYIIHGVNRYPDHLKKLGKYKASAGSCLYINRLSDVDIEVLQSLIKTSVEAMKKEHGG